MPVGTVRTIVRSVTVPANGVAAFSQSAAALPAPHTIRSVDIDDPRIDLVSLTINGEHQPRRVVTPADRVCAVFANGTGGSVTANVTVTLVELGGSPPL
jgi:hypothetical protein